MRLSLSASKLILVSFCCVDAAFVFCQTDSIDRQQRINYITNFYKQAAADQLPLYTGPVYQAPGTDIKGEPFFQSADWQPGTLIFDAESYEGVRLKYDIYKNELLILNFNGQAVSLSSRRLAEFSIGDRTFVPVPEEMSPGPNKPLFFAQLYKGVVQVLVKHLKMIEKTLDDKVEQEYYTKTSYYILKDGIYHEVGSIGTVLSVFKDKKGELRDYYRKRSLNFKAYPEQVLIELSQQYDMLTVK